MRNVIQCVVPEKKPYPPRTATEIQRVGGGDPEGGNSRGGWGWPLEFFFFFPGAPSTIDEEVISHFIVNRCFKAKIIFHR